MDVYSAAEARTLGFTRGELARAVAAGEVLRIRRDHYTAPDADPLTVEAIRIGGVLGCVSALRAFDVWVSDSPELHVHVAPNASRLRRGTAVRHWKPLLLPRSRTTVSILDALVTATCCQRPLDAVASIDSALNRGLIRRSDLVPHLAGPREARLLDLTDGRAQSGLETYVRVPLRRLGLRVVPQARIRGVGRGDVLVEGCVLVETDGEEFHSGPRRHVDYLRDAATAREGLTPLRFDSTQVRFQTEPVLLSVIEAVAQHRRCTISGRRLESMRRRVRWALWT